MTAKRETVDEVWGETFDDLAESLCNLPEVEREDFLVEVARRACFEKGVNEDVVLRAIAELLHRADELSRAASKKH